MGESLAAFLMAADPRATVLILTGLLVARAICDLMEYLEDGWWM